MIEQFQNFMMRCLPYLSICLNVCPNRLLMNSDGSGYLMIFGQKAFIILIVFGLGLRQTSQRNLRTIQTSGNYGIGMSISKIFKMQQQLGIYQQQWLFYIFLQLVIIPQMSLMLIGYLTSYIGLNVFLIISQFDEKKVFLAIWNASNVVYMVINLLLLVIINFQTFQWVKYCLLQVCFVELSDIQSVDNPKQEAADYQKTLQKIKTESNIKSRKLKQQYKKKQKGFIKKMFCFFKGFCFSIITPILDLILIVSAIMFFFKKVFSKDKQIPSITNIPTQQNKNRLQIPENQRYSSQRKSTITQLTQKQAIQSMNHDFIFGKDKFKPPKYRKMNHNI